MSQSEEWKYLTNNKRSSEIRYEVPFLYSYHLWSNEFFFVVVFLQGLDFFRQLAQIVCNGPFVISQ